jgi:hypothetical protein
MWTNILLFLLFGGIFAFAFGGVGVLLITRYRKSREEVAQSSNWPGVTGKIEVSSAGIYSKGREIDHSDSPTYAPQIEYTYVVNGLAYRGSRIGFGDVTGTTHRAAVHAADRFPTGSACTVYYDPADPSKAVLEKKVNNSIGSIVMMLIFILLGLFACGASVWAIVNEVMNAS